MALLAECAAVIALAHRQLQDSLSHVAQLSAIAARTTNCVTVDKVPTYCCGNSSGTIDGIGALQVVAKACLQQCA